MLEIIRFIVILLLILLSIITIWVLYKTIKYARKSRRLFKSAFNSTFKNLFSSILIIIFFSVSFSVVAGTIQSTKRIGNSLDELFVDNNLHFSYTNLDNVEKYEDTFFHLENGTTTNEEFLLKYFNYNNSVVDFFIYLYAYKNISTFLADDSMKNLLWKYELSYYMTNEASSWGYQYIALNNYYVGKMLIDNIRGSPQPIDNYLYSDYKDSSLTQQSKNGTILVDDYDVVSSLGDGGINDIFLDNNFASSTSEYDVKVGVGADWAEANNVKVGDIISLPQPFGTNINAKVVVTFRVPQYVFPSFTLSKVIPDTSEQTYVLMSTMDFVNYFSSVATANLFFGFSDLYNDVNHYTDYTSNFVQTRIKNYNDKLNKFLFPFFSGETINKFNTLSDYSSIRVETVFVQIKIMKILTKILIVLFLIIIIGILIILIKKKIKQSTKEIGTLKAIGWTPQKIAISFIAFPITIILVGGVFAIFLSFLIQIFWIKIWKRQFLISSGHLIFPPMNLLIIFILPIVILLVISYFVTLRLLKKPTLDLINDVDEYKPNFLIRSTNSITNRFSNFITAYRTKSIFRSVGKSTVLFTSTLFSIIILSFAISGTNIINNTVDLINKSIKFDNAFIIDQNKNVNLIETQDALDMQESGAINYYTFVSLNSTQENELLSIEDDANASANIEIFFQENIQSKITGSSFDERANSFDALYGSYINTTTFNSSNTVIPWQAFELLNVSLDYVENDEIIPNKDIPLPTSQLTINNYENIYNQYIKYYNYNFSLEANNNDIVRPNVTMNTIIYDQNNETTFNSSLINWQQYIDSYTGKKLTSVDDLGIHQINYDGTLYVRETYNTVTENYENEYVYGFYENGKYNDVGGQPSVEEYIASLNSALPSNTWIERGEESNYNIIDDGTNQYRTKEISLNKFVQSTAISADEFSSQWISFVNNYNDISKIINFDDQDAQNLNNYEPKSVDVIYNGSTTSVNTIPIIIDSTNANRLGISEGDIYKTDNIDKENSQLYNNLRLSGVNGPIAFDVVGIYDSAIPFGAFTLWEYLYLNTTIHPKIIFQENSSQEGYYSFTSYYFTNGDTLQAAFKNDFHGNYDAIINKNVVQKQVDFIASIIIILFFSFSFFASFIAISLISISIKEIADDATHEISILKALGFSNKKSTFLIINPYLLIMTLSIIIIVPLNIIFFVIISSLISSNLGGYGIHLGVTLLQWLFIVFCILLFFVFLIYIVYLTFRKQNALEALNKE